MIKVSYKRFQRIKKVVLFFSDMRWELSEHYRLQELFDLIVPKRWRNVFYCPYYYVTSSKKHCPKILYDKLEYIHKYVKSNVSETEGILKEFAIAMDDNYYIIVLANGTEEWVSAIEKIERIK